MWYLIVSIPDLCTLAYFGLGSMTSRNPNKGVEFKMAPIDVGHDLYNLLTSDDPVTYLVTPQRVSQ